MAPALAPAAPALDLITVRTRPFLTIDGAKHELRDENDLTIPEFNRVLRILVRMGAIESIADRPVTDAEEQEYVELIREVSALAFVDATAAKPERLSDIQRTEVAAVFFRLLAPSLARTKTRLERHRLTTMETASNSTNSSPGSPGSMAAVRSSGRKGRR